MDGVGTSGSAGTTAGLQPEQQRSYFDELVETFTGKYTDWKAQNEHPPPQTSQEYEASLPNSQTSVCTRMAALMYQANTGVVLEKVTGIDSHMFECRWVDPHDCSLCFHLNFNARVNGTKQFFFAELTGIDRPMIATTCVMLDKNNPFSVRNCKFCTGMWHPVDGGFLGKQ